MIYFESRYESMKAHKNFWLNLVANINTYAVIIETSKSSIKIPHYKNASHHSFNCTESHQVRF